MPRCGGSQRLQIGELPELRGDAAAQAVVFKVPDRGASEREGRGGTEGRNADGGKCNAPLPLHKHPHPPCPPAHNVAPLAIYPDSTMAQTGVSGPVVVEGESFSDALFASAG